MSYVTNVKEVYLRVIDATIARTKEELTEGDEPNEKLNATLEALRDTWQTRLLKESVFDETLDAPGAAAGENGFVGDGKSVRNKVPRKSALQPTPPADKLYVNTRKPLGGGLGQPEQFLPSARKDSAPGSKDLPGPIPQGDGPNQPGQEPPAKRARIDVKPDTASKPVVEAQPGGRAGEKVNGKDSAAAKEEHVGSDSDDSEIQSDSDDDDAENFILAQHDKVKKGSGKWKVSLKDGIIHCNGRDYLFSKGSCDLDW